MGARNLQDAHLVNNIHELAIIGQRVGILMMDGLDTRTGKL